MIKLSDKTMRLIEILYQNKDEKLKVVNALENQCAENMPLTNKSTLTPESLERIRFAVLKLTHERGKFEEWVKLATQDWRDLLVYSGLWRATNSHQIWYEYISNIMDGKKMFCGCPKCKELFEAQFNEFGHRYNCSKCGGKEILEVEQIAHFG